MLTVLVSTISNSQVFLLKKCECKSECKSYSHFVSKNISIYAIYAIFNDQSFNDTLTNDIISFEQLGPGSCANITWFSGIYTRTSDGSMQDSLDIRI